MQLRRTRTFGPIGVELGASSIKLAQVVRGPAGLRLSAAAVVPMQALPWTDANARELGNVLHRQGFVGTNLVVGMPPQKSYTEILELPPRDSGAPLEQIARSEIARMAKIDDENFEFGCWDLPQPARAGNATSVMAVAVKHVDADELMSPLEAEGFAVLAIDTPACALCRAVVSTCDPAGIVAVVDLNRESPQVVLSHKGTPLYQRNLDCGGLAQLLENLVKQLELPLAEAEYLLLNCPSSDATGEDAIGYNRVRKLIDGYVDELAHEVRGAASYAAHRYAKLPVEQVIMTGDGVSIGGLSAALQTRVHVPTQIFTPLESLRPGSIAGSHVNGGMLATAIGLALWEGQS